MGKEYICFQIDGKSAQVDKCVKSRIITKVIDYILSINTFGQKYVMIKAMLQSTCLDDNMMTIGINQTLTNSAIFEHNMLGSVMTNNFSKILLRPTWFIILNDSPIIVPDIL